MWEERRERHGPGRAARPLAAEDPAAARRAVDADDAAADPARDVLRPAGLPPGRARPRRLRDRQAAVPDVGDDVRRPRCSGPRLAAGFAPKRVAQAGLVALVLASLLLLGDDRRGAATRPEFAIALAVFGVGAGLLLSQLGNVIMSSVDPAKTNEAGGLQGTAQNLGASLGTALIGAVLIAALTSGFVSRVEDNPAVPQAARDADRAGRREGHPGGAGGRRREGRDRRGAVPASRRRRSPTTTATRSSRG